MRVRAAVFLLAALLATGCSGSHAGAPGRESLKLLDDVSVDGSNFGVIIDGKTGKALSAFRVNRSIRAAVPDGRGGWYVGGGFIRVNGVLRKRLAHIGADGRLDRHWRPEANGNGVSVTALARIGSRLYVSGDFAKLDRAKRWHLGAIDVSSGKLDRRWQPAASYWNPVLLAVAGRLIVGGGTGLPVSAVVALDPETGQRDRHWDGTVDASNLEGGGVQVLARAGRLIYVGGVFNAVDGVPRTGLAALDAKTGRLDRDWTFPDIGVGECHACNTPLALTAYSGRVYMSANGPSRYSLVALDSQTGRVQRWHAQLGSIAAFYGGSFGFALAAAENRVYVGGDFDSVDGTSRNSFAALDAKTARVVPAWNPPGNTVYASFLARSGSRLLLGIQLSRQVQFDFTGLKTFRPVRQLSVRLALSGPGSVTIGLGRGCNYRRWTESGRCGGRLFRSLGIVHFPRAERRRYRHHLDVTAGRYFVRFSPRADGEAPQPPSDFPITVR
jgi:hypothetical protein